MAVNYQDHAVRDGNRVLRFIGWQLAAVSSTRPGVQRWSELSIYRTASGDYLLEKIGRSSVAHDPDCRFVTHRMPSWLEAREEGKHRRTACTECRPTVGDEMDPHTRLEVQRYTVRIASTLDALVDMLVDGRDALPVLVSTLISQARVADKSVGLDS